MRVGCTEPSKAPVKNMSCDIPTNQVEECEGQDSRWQSAASGNWQSMQVRSFSDPADVMMRIRGRDSFR
ncbi:hypothetical protein CEXT_655311 [Caerostris extrusa]|uniref:Uncharacterized protein n=1 Tax=Caerostris extrusa TaxID=172846 RepID=A0AAV4PW46_CAEEX|nr:hypothetical protein CEXT_655311 [Caerostris extrusa]